MALPKKKLNETITEGIAKVNTWKLNKRKKKKQYNKILNTPLWSAKFPKEINLHQHKTSKIGDEIYYKLYLKKRTFKNLYNFFYLFIYDYLLSNIKKIFKY